MIKTIKHIISLCALTSLLALSFISCAQPTAPEIKYKVSFNENGHGARPSAIEVDENTILSSNQLPTLTTHEEFNFIGWLDENGKQVKDKYKVTKNVTFKAEWTPWDTVADVVYSIKNGQEIDINDELIITCPTEDATIYCTVEDSDGTKTNITGKNSISFKIKGLSTISAYATKKGMKNSNTKPINLTIKTYTVTFQNEKGDAPAAITGLTKNSTLRPEQIKQLDYITGFDFAGWTVDGKKFDENYPITKNITVTANWKEWEKVANVKFNISSNAVDYGDVVILTCATEGAKIHYIKGDEAEDNVDSPCTIRLDSPGSITAWGTKERMNNSDETTENYTFKTYTVSYDTKGIVSQPESYTGWKGDIVTPLPNFQDVKGFTFDGWYNGDTKITDTFVEIGTSDITLTAKWIPHVILSTGDTVRYDQITEDQKSKAIAVACGINSEGKLLGLGLKQSDSTLVWATQNTTGYNTNFKEIVCTPSPYNEMESLTDKTTFIGDTDGIDNWEKICAQDSNAEKTNYPAFDWVNNYGKTNTYMLPPDYQNGWYMPSIAELTEIYRNREVINAALTTLGTEIASPLKESWYWSSSQHGSFEYCAWRLNLVSGLLGDCIKYFDLDVCCVRAF